MPTQTPASRKFRLPPSTAPNSTSTQKPPAFAASQFIRPSQTSSSPYARTPFSSTAQKIRKDEIVADDSLSDDGDADQLNTVSSRREESSTQPFHTSAKNNSIDDLSNPNPTQPPQQPQPIPSGTPQIPSTKRRKITHSLSEIIDDDLDLPSPPSSPTHDHTTTNQPERTQIHVSRSSPGNPQIEDDNLDHNPPSSPTSSLPPSPPHNLQTPRHRHKPPTSRFRATQPTQPTQAPSNPLTTTLPIPNHIYPSFQSRLLASTSTSVKTSPSTNPLSTLSPGPHIRGPRPNLDLTLPDAFSPSRKRGQRGYVHGGLAETVRGWVVEMATRVAGGAGRGIGGGIGTADTNTTKSGPNDDKDKPSGTNRITVDQILLNDNNGRFTMIQSRPGRTTHHNIEDQTNLNAVSKMPDRDRAEHGEIWMLINTDPQARRTAGGGGGGSRVDSNPRLSGIRPGQKITIKGGESMTWDLNIDLHHSQDLAEKSYGKRVERCKVAVLWEVGSGTR